VKNILRKILNKLIIEDSDAGTAKSRPRNPVESREKEHRSS
jgi:hypothetical protein